MSFLKSLGKIAQAALPVAIEMAIPGAAINTAVAAGVKHGTPINNQHIPLLNLAVSTGVTYLSHAASSGDWAGSILPAIQHGGLLAAGSTALHQSLKIPLAQVITGTLAQRVGPGDRFSL